MAKAPKNAINEKKVTRYTYDDIKEPRTPETGHTSLLPADEQDRLRQAVRDAANDGLFTPSSHLRYHIQFPGAWGGANWGSTAGDPATGMLYVRSLEMPSYRRMALDVPRPPALPG